MVKSVGVVLEPAHRTLKTRHRRLRDVTFVGALRPIHPRLFEHADENDVPPFDIVFRDRCRSADFTNDRVHARGEVGVAMQEIDR